MAFTSAETTNVLFGRHVFEDSKCSENCGATVEAPTFLSQYGPDALRQPAPLFKLDESMIGEEYARLEW